MSLKSLREHLCEQQTAPKSDDWPSDIASAVDVLINMIDRHRPLGSDGSHGDLHTPTCGCDPFLAASSSPASSGTSAEGAGQ